MSEMSENKPEVLVVDDSKVIRIAAKKMLGSDYVIHLAEDGLIGWEMLQQNGSISVVFTDLSMPNLDGVGLLKNIRSSSNDSLADLPVIIMTGHDDNEETKAMVFAAGATDFITKPFESIDLLSRAKAYARLNRQVVELEKKTGHDKLTGLLNADALYEQGVKAFSFSDRHKLFISTVYFEIKDFQACYSRYGKNVAQHIIKAAGQRLQEVMREEDVAARIGVAKYALVLPMTNRQKAEIVVNRVRESINKLVFNTGKEKIRVDFVAGYTSSESDSVNDFKTMLEQADDALHRAIDSTDTPIVCFKDAVEAEEPKRIISEQDVELALKHIMAGDYYLIPEQHLEVVVERLSSFMEYVENSGSR